MEYFSAIPWCAAILNDPDTVTFTPPCRLSSDQNGHLPTKDQLVRKTFCGDDGIPHAVAFYKRTSLNSSPPFARRLHFLTDSTTLMMEIRPGLNGYNGGAHGGLIATLFDEAMGTLIFQNHEVFKEMERAKQKLQSNILNMHGLALFTATMSVRYQKPVVTPQIVLVTASLDRIEGRKVFLKTALLDRNGVILACGDGMWISIPEKQLAVSEKL
jgi:acyl-coenzyme A thioesterase PaaI-like protein